MEYEEQPNGIHQQEYEELPNDTQQIEYEEKSNRKFIDGIMELYLKIKNEN